MLVIILNFREILLRVEIRKGISKNNFGICVVGRIIVYLSS